MRMLKVDKDSMRNDRIFSLMNKDSKILSKLLAKQIQQYVQRMMFHYNVVLIPGM